MNPVHTEQHIDSSPPVEWHFSRLLHFMCNGDLNATGMCSIHLWPFLPATPHSWRALFVPRAISVRDNAFLLCVLSLLLRLSSLAEIKHVFAAIIGTYWTFISSVS